ncbi:hypothetical protein H323_05530 [Vibrio parahaemolyticus VP766]|nr:hypothetical protein H323_05530 [Vibrio parahaemolyticus VP766]
MLVDERGANDCTKMIYICTKVVRIKIVAPQCDSSIAYSAQFLSKSQFVLCND